MVSASGISNCSERKQKYYHCSFSKHLPSTAVKTRVKAGEEKENRTFVPPLPPPNGSTGSSQGQSYRPVEFDHRLSLSFLPETSILGSAKSLTALLLVFPPPLLIRRLLSILLLWCNLQPCLIDGVMMKVAGGGMVVPCFSSSGGGAFQTAPVLHPLLHPPFFSSFSSVLIENHDSKFLKVAFIVSLFFSLNQQWQKYWHP